MTERELRTWAEAHAPAGCPQAAAVLVLLDEAAALRRRERRAVPRPEPVELMRLADDGCPLAESMA